MGSHYPHGTRINCFIICFYWNHLLRHKYDIKCYIYYSSYFSYYFQLFVIINTLDIPMDKDGKMDPEAILKAFKENTDNLIEALKK